jgi:hypothetical protein
MRVLQADVIGLHMSSFHAGSLQRHITDDGGAGQFPGKGTGCENFRAKKSRTICQLSRTEPYGN